METMHRCGASRLHPPPPRSSADRNAYSGGARYLAGWTNAQQRSAPSSWLVQRTAAECPFRQVGPTHSGGALYPACRTNAQQWSAPSGRLVQRTAVEYPFQQVGPAHSSGVPLPAGWSSA
ncbi:unnamed protein product [Victoria cruziana]